VTRPGLGRLRLGLAGVLGLLAVALAYRTWHAAITYPANGKDFHSLWDAATALTRGRSIYGDRSFVYLPTTAVLFLPFTLLRYGAALKLNLALDTLALAVAFGVAVIPVRREWRLVAVTAAVAFVMKTDVLRELIWYGNASLLVAPLAVLALLGFERGRWGWGCAALVVGIAIKPVIVALLLIPVLRGRWRELLGTVGPLIVVVVLLSLGLPGTDRLLHLPGYILGGTDLETGHVAANISLQGVGRRLGVAAPFTIARVLMIMMTLAAIGGWLRRRQAGDTAALGTLLLLTSMFAGRLGENSYLYVAAPCLLLTLAHRRSGGPAVIGLVAFLVLLIPASSVGVNMTIQAQQIRDLSIGLGLYLAALWVALSSGYIGNSRRVRAVTPAVDLVADQRR
jgi:hypothetical protein